MSIEFVVKNDGRTEPFMPEKLNKWCDWAAEHKIPWSQITFAVNRLLDGTVTSKQIQETIIYVCNQSDDMAYHKMAARIMVGVIYKEAFGSFENIPSLKDYYHQMVDAGHWEDMNYKDAELVELGEEIDHSLDFTYSYASLRQMYEKYLLQDVINKHHFESPQFMNMGIAMHNLRNMPKSRRLDDVKVAYSLLSQNEISLPTPILAAQRTGINKFASCCLLTCADEAESISIQNWIAYMMTTAHAGIGGYMHTRSLGDPVANGTIRHEGKLPYMRYMQAAIGSTKQMGRRGAGTFYYTCLDPEIRTLLELKGVNTPVSRQIRELDYSLLLNKKFLNAALKNEDWMLVSPYYAEDLYALFFSDKADEFNMVYDRIWNDMAIPKTIVKARDILNLANKQWYETGRIYKTFIDNMNHHTPFKDPIYSSNLCVHGDTLLLTEDGPQKIADLAGQTVTIWNGLRYIDVPVEKTGENQRMIEVTVHDRASDTSKKLICTPYHKFYLRDGTEVRAGDLKFGQELLRWMRPEGKKQRIDVDDIVIGFKWINNVHDSYCVNEPLRHMAVFNGILTGQCEEIALPTAPFHSMKDVYATENGNLNGEVALCFIGAIVAGRVKESEYEKAAYYLLLMLDNVIEEMEYPLPNIEYTAKNRRSVGVGIINLANWMAINNKKYSEKDGQVFIHDYAEMHSYYLHKASLKLAKERGVAGWMNKTKYPDGWLPIDTYSKALDEITDILHYDWEGLRKEIIATGGIRNSVLEAHMPAESSAIKADCTNSIYPIRDYLVKKGNKENLLKFWAPGSDDIWTKLAYEKAFDIPTLDMIKCYGLVQKFSGQTISADFYFKPDPAKGNKKGTTEQLIEIANMHKYGMKTHYYLHTKSSGDEEITTSVDMGCSSGACTL